MNLAATVSRGFTVIIDIIDGDDWKVVYVDGRARYAGHSIPDWMWMDLAILPLKKISRWEMDMMERAAPETFNASPDQLEKYGISLISEQVAAQA